jgi:hypothetical protein
VTVELDSIRPLLLASLIGLATGGCYLLPPPFSSTATTASPPPPSAPDPVPPKCEALLEQCMATESTRALVQDSGWTVAPPPGWTYAQNTEGTLVEAHGTALGVVAYDVPAKKADHRRDEVLHAVLAKLGVTFPKAAKLTWPKHPDKVTKVGKIAVSLFQFDGASREKKPGPVLVFSARLSASKMLLGVGFVPDDDDTGADEAILKLIDSIGPAGEKQSS